jgi:protein-tyrosine phosphatase
VISVLFVCTGNICRSPTAEGVFRHLVEEAGLGAQFRIESAGTDSYHEGAPPDPRAISIAQKNGVSLDGQTARALARGDYNDFDYIFAMDGSHFYELHQRAPKTRRAQIHMFLGGTRQNSPEVPDPWYGNERDFEHVFQLVDEGARGILAMIRKEHNL